MTRVRFETKCIAPDGLPTFQYRAAVLGHSTVQYTAISSESAGDVIGEIRNAWPDATILVLDREADDFIAADSQLTYKDYGTASRPEPKPRGFFSRLFGHKTVDLGHKSGK